jgi:ribosomal-protein-alanine N-acetyltransferase
VNERVAVAVVSISKYDDDGAALAELLRDCEVQLDVAAELRNPHAEFAICRSDGRVVGFALIWRVADELELISMAVHPTERRRGLGTALLEWVIARARELGLRAVFLEVRKGNEPALMLYRGAGFYALGVRRGYYSNPIEDAVLMTRALEATDSSLT